MAGCLTIIAVCCLFLVYSEVISGCTSGFVEMDLLMKRAEKIPGDGTNDDSLDEEFRLLNSATFSCSGNMTGLLLVELLNTDGRNQYPEIQIWRNTGGNTYTKQGSEEIRLAEGDFSPDGVLQYNLTTPISFQSGDVLGIYHPKKDESVVRIYYRNSNVVTYRVSENPTSSINLPDLSSVSDELILVSPVSDSPCTGNFLSRTALKQHALNVNINDVVDRDRDQRLFPDIHFTCNGFITKWIIGVEDTGNSMDSQPELQIWRNSGGMSYVKTNFSLPSGSPSSNNVFEYTPNPAIEFQNGDILGVYQPRTEDSELVVYYQRRDGPVNYDLGNNALSSVTLGSPNSLYDYPLVTVEISTVTPSSTTSILSVVSSSIPEDAPMTTSITNAPMTTSIAEVPTTTSIAEAPMTTSIAEVPTTTSIAEAPITTSIAEAPMTTSIAEAQTTTSIAEAQTTTSIAEAPMTTSIAEVPTTTSIAEAPMTTNIAEAPTTTSIAEAPMTTSIAEAPMTTNIAEAPMTTNITNITDATSIVIAPTATSDTKVVIATTSAAELSSMLVSSMSTRASSIGSTLIMNSIVNLTSTMHTSSDLSGDSTAAAAVSILLAIFVLAAVSMIVVILIVLKRKRKTKEAMITSIIYTNTDSEILKESEASINTRPIMELYNLVDTDNYETPVVTQTSFYEQLSGSHRQQPPLSISSPLYQWGIVVPTVSERKAFIDPEGHYEFNEEIYSSVEQDIDRDYETVKESFFEETVVYWEPGSNCTSIYEQLSQNRYREIMREHMKIGEHLGSGQFGRVNKGVWTSPNGPVNVAIKTLKDEASEVEKVKFLQEAAIMGQFHHTNIISLHGVVTLAEPPMIVLELMKNGDLKEHLYALRPTPGELPPSSLPQKLLGYCSQIASGMEYLSKKCFVHRDLAARNILLDDKKTCKIADFGMSRDLSDSDYYVSQGGKIPIKWTAPEALHFKKYSTASDVWSFGVLMYEIWSLGHKPFEGKTNHEALTLIDTGYRLCPPPGCPRAVYQIMMDCWHPKASGRLSFSIVMSRLSQPEKQLLKWADNVSHSQSTTVGAPLETAFNLHPDLQQQYL